MAKSHSENKVQASSHTAVVDIQTDFKATWAEIDKFMQLPRKEEGDYDINYWMNRYGLKRSATESRLAQLVKDYVLEVREVVDNGTPKRVWRIKAKST